MTVHIIDAQGVVRLLNAATNGQKLDLNLLWMRRDLYSLDEFQELYQLIGYSISGYEEIFDDARLKGER